MPALQTENRFSRSDDDEGGDDGALFAVNARFSRIGMFPDLHGRFVVLSGPDRGTVWMVAPLGHLTPRPGFIYARRPHRYKMAGTGHNGKETGQYDYRWFPLADCASFGGTAQ